MPEAAPPAPVAPAAAPATPKPPPGGAPPTPAQGAPSAKPPGGDSAAASDPNAPASPGPVKAKDHAALAREAFELRQRQKAIRAKEQEWTKERETLAAQAKEAETLRNELAAAKADREAFLKDPIAWAQKHGGAKAEQAIQAWLNSTTPEKALAELREADAKRASEVEELKAELKRRDEAAAKEREETQRQQAAAAEQALVRGFVSAVTSDAKKYPHLNALFEPEQIAAKAREFSEMAKREEWIDEAGNRRVGKAYSFAEVANAFEQYAKRVYDKQEERRKSLLTPSEEGAEPGTALGVQTKPAPGNGRREGTNGPGTSTTPKPEKKPRILTRREQEREDLAKLRAAMAKDAETAKATARH